MTATERAKRSDALYHDQITHRKLCDMIANRESDIEDLRELCADIWRHFTDKWPHEGCSEDDGCDSVTACAAEVELERRMRIAGVRLRD